MAKIAASAEITNPITVKTISPSFIDTEDTGFLPFRYLGAMKQTLAATAIALLALTGCASTAEPADEKAPATNEQATETAPAEAAPAPADLVGEWKQSNASSSTSYQVATITADTISIDWVNEEQSSTSVYWVGTFTAPTDAGDWSWTSTRDAAATDSALLASTDDTKDFTYSNDVISYDVTAMGTTVTVELAKQ